MIVRSLSMVPLMLVTLASAGCAFHSSPADALTFTAPGGWTASPGILGFMQFWRPRENDGEFLMLFRSPQKLQSTDVFSNERYNENLKGATMLARQSIRICGSQPATYVQARRYAERGGGIDLIELVMADVNGSTYFATYERPATLPPNPAAQASLRELCAKP